VAVLHRAHTGGFSSALQQILHSVVADGRKETYGDASSTSLIKLVVSLAWARAVCILKI
jgi:hypothetical protein